MRSILFLCASLIAFSLQSKLAAAEDSGISLPVGTWEFHGTAKLRGQATAEKFWLRLKPTDAAYGHNRIVEVVYTPPTPATLGGTHLSDTPFWLLDPRSRLMAWNDRGTSSQMQPSAGVYQVTRDRTSTDHTDMVLDEKKFEVNRGWDRTAAPLLVALSWRADTDLTVPCVDLFGDQPLTTISWHGPEVHVGSDTWKVTADEHGRLAKLHDAQGGEVVSVTAWLATGAAPVYDKPGADKPVKEKPVKEKPIDKPSGAK